MNQTQMISFEYNGFTGIAEFLLDQGASINTKDYHLNTPLHLASLRGYIDIVKILVYHGAELNSMNYLFSFCYLIKHPLRWHS